LLEPQKMRILYTHQQLNLPLLLSIFLLLMPSKKSVAQCSTSFLNYQTKNIPIGVEVPKGNKAAYSEIYLPIVFGTEDNLVNGLYGITFNLNIDTSYIDPNSIKLDLKDSWLNNDTYELLSFSEFNKFDSQLTVSITKTNGKGVSGYGNIAYLRIVVMVEVELERLAKDFEVVIENIFTSGKSNHFEDMIKNGLNKIESKETAIKKGFELNTDFDFEVYPNPTFGKLNINSKSQLITTFEVVNLIGSSIYNGDFKNNMIINTETWPSGIYFLHLDNEENHQKKKILVK